MNRNVSAISPVNSWWSLCLAFILLVSLSGCSDEVEDLVEVADGIPRRTIDVSRLGVSAFANQAFAGDTCSQFAEIRNSLGIKYVRVLFAWLDPVQPTPNSSINFGFYDEILSCLPPGVDALVVLTNVPSWMNDPAHWVNDNPRQTFAQRWVRRVAQRYRGDSRIIGYQIWNEPNNEGLPENNVLGLNTSPENYVELMAFGHNQVKLIDPAKLVVNGATTAIAQNFPGTLDYNQNLRDLGIEQFIDVFAIHYYGRGYEIVVTNIRDFLNSMSKPIWVTETGVQGVNEQLPYGERTWPFLRENISGIDRIYVYRFAEATPADVTFGLRNPDPALPVSDLYVHLAERSS